MKPICCSFIFICMHLDTQLFQCMNHTIPVPNVQRPSGAVVCFSYFDVVGVCKQFEWIYLICMKQQLLQVLFKWNPKREQQWETVKAFSVRLMYGECKHTHSLSSCHWLSDQVKSKISLTLVLLLLRICKHIEIITQSEIWRIKHGFIVNILN